MRWWVGLTSGKLLASITNSGKKLLGRSCWEAGFLSQLTSAITLSLEKQWSKRGSCYSLLVVLSLILSPLQVANKIDNCKQTSDESGSKEANKPLVIPEIALLHLACSLTCSLTYLAIILLQYAKDFVTDAVSSFATFWNATCIYNTSSAPWRHCRKTRYIIVCIV